MLGIPDDRRECAEREYDEQRVKTGPSKFGPQARHEREHEKDRDEFEGVGEFAKKPEANQQPGEGPPPGKLRTFLERNPEGVEGRHPKENRERIDRHDQSTEIKDRRYVNGDDRPEASSGTEQSLRKIIEEQTRARGEERTPKADAKFVIAKNRRAGANNECDARPVAKVGER